MPLALRMAEGCTPSRARRLAEFRERKSLAVVQNLAMAWMLAAATMSLCRRTWKRFLVQNFDDA